MCPLCIIRYRIGEQTKVTCILHLALIIHESFLKMNPEVEMISEDEIGETEEKNFELLEAQSAPKFRDRIEGSLAERIL